MAKNSTISVTLKLNSSHKDWNALLNDADALKSMMQNAVVEAEHLKKSIINWSQSVQAIDAVSNAVGQLNDVIQGVVAESNGFEQAMRAVNTMAWKDAEGYKEMKKQVAGLAKEIPIARDALAEGLYQVISNAVPEDNWMSFLEKSARTSVGAIADLQQVVTVSSTIIKNYGLEWSAVGNIQDKIQLTAKNGVTTFEQLAAALPRVSGNAATLGVSVDELLGAFATLTGVSGNTAEVSTQLAAVFTALVKPSSEAAKMADAMGVSFNAAAIRGAGGLQNFLTSLDAAVKSYAASSGMLEQEIYGRLFGSAEALRALIPLNGELADKFASNVSDMVNSAGTIDQAFEQMSQTGEARRQLLENQAGTFWDLFAGISATVGPLLDFTASAGLTAMSVASLSLTMKKLHAGQKLVALGNKLVSASMVVLTGRTVKLTTVTRVFSGAMRTGAYSATAMKIALKALYTAAGIGIAITAVTLAIKAFSDSADEATGKTEELNEAEEAYKNAAAEAKVEIDGEIKALGDLIKAKGDTADAIDRLNRKYGEIFGSHKTAEEWYDVLTSKSQAYIRMLGYEAQARVLAAKIAENQVKQDMAAQKMEGMREDGTATQKKLVRTSYGIYGSSTFEQKEVNTEPYQQLVDQSEELKKEQADLEAQLETTMKGIRKYGAALGNASLSGKKISGSGDDVDKDVKKAVSQRESFDQFMLKMTRDREDSERAILAESWQKKIADATAAHERWLADTRATYEKNLEYAGANGENAAKLTEEFNALVLAKDAELSAKRVEILKSYSLQAISEYMRQTGDVKGALEASVAKLTVHKVKPVDTGEAAKPSLDTDLVASLRLRLEGIEEAKQQLESLRSLLAMGNLTEEEKDAVNESIGEWERYAATLGGLVKPKGEDAANALSSIGSIVRATSRLVNDQTASWIEWGAGVLNAIATAIPQIIALTTANKASANANAENAVTGAAASVASTPVVGWMMVGAAVASVIAAMASIPKFAEGGIAYGPTLGLFGEYAGAHSNPEVVAPLDKLRSMLQPSGGERGDVVFRIEGRTLVGILKKEETRTIRTR